MNKYYYYKKTKTNEQPYNLFVGKNDLQKIKAKQHWNQVKALRWNNRQKAIFSNKKMTKQITFLLPHNVAQFWVQSCHSLIKVSPCFTNDIKKGWIGEHALMFPHSFQPTHFKVTFISFLVEIDFLFLFFCNLFSPKRDEANASVRRRKSIWNLFFDWIHSNSQTP